MNATNATVARKIWDLLTSAERRSAVVLLGLMCVDMVLETLGAGLMIPTIALLTQRDVARHYPALHPVLHALGTPSEQTLVIGGMLAQDRVARRLLEIGGVATSLGLGAVNAARTGCPCWIVSGFLLK